MSTTLQEAHKSHLKFKSDIAKKAAAVRPRNTGTYTVPVRPFDPATLKRPVLKVALPAIRKHRPRPYDPDEERAWLIEIVGFDYRSYVADRVPVDDIQRVVCSFFDLPRASMLTASRQKVIVRPRQIAIYLAKTMTLRSMPDIGQRFGGRDHTTVLHAIRTIEVLIKTDREVADVVAYLTEVLKERSCTNQHHPEA